MFHSKNQLKKMTTESLRNFLVGCHEAANVRQMQRTQPETRGYNLNRKADCLALYRQVWKQHKDKQIWQYHTAVIDVATAINTARDYGNHIVPPEDDSIESARRLMSKHGHKYVGINCLKEALESSLVDIESGQLHCLAVDTQLHLLMKD